MNTNNLPYSNYASYLAHPEFKAVRRVVMDAAGGVCQSCGVAPATEVHHRFYPAWGTFDRPEYLLPVCHACHCVIERKEQ